MASIGHDSDNMRAVRWKKKIISPSLRAPVVNASSENLLFNTIKESIQSFVNDVYGNIKDQKYRNYVDLLMLRIKSDLSQISIQDSCEALDTSKIKSMIVKSLKKAYSDSNTEQLKYDDVIDAVMECINCDGLKNRTIEENKEQNAISIKQFDNDIDAKQSLIKTIFNTVNNNGVIKSINDSINGISSAVELEFKKLNSLMTDNMSFLNLNFKSDAIKHLNGIRIAYAQIYRKSYFAGDVQKYIKNNVKKNSFNISINGIKINSKMIDDLSSNAVKSMVYDIQIIKQYNKSISDQFYMLHENIKQRTEYTNGTINQIRGKSNVLDLIKRVFNYLLDFAKKKLLPRFKKEIVPILNTIIKRLKEKLPDSVKTLIENIKNAAGPVIVAINDIVQAFIAAAELALKGIRFVFQLICNSITKAFGVAISVFGKTLNAILKGAIATLKGLWELIKAARRLIVKGLAWVGGLTWRLAKFAFDKIKKSKFGQAIGRFVDKLISPFRKIRDAIALRFQNVKRYLSELFSKNGKIGSVIHSIKTKICTLATNIKNYVMRRVNIIKNSISRGIRTIRVFIRRKIINKFIKFPARRFMNWIKKRVGKFLGKKVAKKAAGGAMKRLMKSMLKLLAKFLGKIAAKILSGLALAATGIGVVFEWLVTYGWLTYDIFRMYGKIKKLFMPVARELGYDLTKPAWFERFLWENKRLLADFVINNYGDFLNALKDAITEMFFGAMAEVRVKTISANKRQDFRNSRWGIYNEYIDKKDTICPKINPFDKKAVRRFLEHRLDDYSHIIKDIVHIKKLDERLNVVADEMGSVETETEWWSKPFELLSKEDSIYKSFERIFNLRMDYTEDLMRRVMTSGLFIVFENCYKIALGSRTSILQRYAWDTWAEADLTTLMLIYNEAYAGIQYVDFLLNRGSLNESFKQYVSEQKEFHATYHLDIDKLKELLNQHVRDQDNFYNTANNLHVMLNKKYEQIQDQIDNTAGVDADESAKIKDKIRQAGEDASRSDESDSFGNSFLIFARKRKSK